MKHKIGYIHGYGSSSEKSGTIQRIRDITGAHVIGIDYDTPDPDTGTAEEFVLIYDGVIAQVIGNRPFDLLVGSSFGGHVLNAISTPFIIDGTPKLLINPSTTPQVNLKRYGHSDVSLSGLHPTGHARPNTTVVCGLQDSLVDPEVTKGWATQDSEYKDKVRLKCIDADHRLTFEQLENLFRNDNLLQRFLSE